MPVNEEDSEDAGLIPGLGRSPEEGNDNQLQYVCLENHMDRGTGEATVTKESDMTELPRMHSVEQTLCIACVNRHWAS